MRYTDLNLQLDGQDVVMADEFTGPGILALLQGVDGAGSGLDADLHDGQEASSFAGSSHNHDSAYASLTHNHDGVYVSSSDGRLSDARAPLSHNHSADKLVQANTHESADTDTASSALHHTLYPGSGSGRADSGGPASCLGVAQRSCYGLCRG